MKNSISKSSSPQFLTPSRLAIAIGLISVLLIWVIPALFSCSQKAAVLQEEFIKKYIAQPAYIYVYDSTVQCRAHIFALIGIALFAVIFSKYRINLDKTICRKFPVLLQPFNSQWRAFLRIANIILIVVLLLVLGYFKRKVIVGAIPIGFLAVFVAKKYLGKRISDVILWVLLGIYVWLFMLLGFNHLPLVPQFNLDAIESTYSVTMGQADQLAVGGRWFQNVFPFYGFFLPTVLGAIERHFGLLNFADHVQIIQSFQIFFCFLAMFAFYLWKPRGPIFILLPLLIIVPWLRLHYGPIFAPTVSAWRLIGFPLGMVILLLVRKMNKNSAALILGFFAGMLLLINFESGVCIAAGYFVFLFTRFNWPRLRQTASSVVVFLVGLCGMIIIFLLAAKSYFPFSSGSVDTEALALFLGKHITGELDGMPPRFEPIAILIFFYAAFVVSRSMILMGRAPLGNSGRMKLAISTMIITWFIYYINRPAFENLWTHMFLYSFLLMDFIDGRKWRLVKNIRKGNIPLSVVFPWLIITPYVITSNVEMLKWKLLVIESWKSAVHNTKRISGIDVIEPFASSLEERADYLQGEARGGHFMYFTVHPYLMLLLSGIDHGLPVQDTVAVAAFNDYLDLTVKRTLALAPARILFDAPESLRLDSHLINSKIRQANLSRIQEALKPYYRVVGVSHGWQIWERV